jgi:tRNA-2-methylthio-N6-dimethylallyladenosine synthase
LHVPAQSGSNDVLARMKRGYTVEDYREMYGRIRDYLPDAAVTSDFIVGFCGETEADFQKSYDLVAECRFKNSFIFKYSERPGTKGAELYADDVPFDVKNRRNNELLELQNRISEQDSQRLLGQRVEVLVEGASDRAKSRGDVEGDIIQLTGRTPDDRIVVFDGPPRLVGEIIPVAVYDVSPHTLFGAVVIQDAAPALLTVG